MVHLETMRAQEKHYNKNLERYVKEHAEEFVVLEGFVEIRETFFKRKKNLDEYLKKYEGQYGSTHLVKEIPHSSLLDKCSRPGLPENKEGMVV